MVGPEKGKDWKNEWGGERRVAERGADSLLWKAAVIFAVSQEERGEERRRL